MPELSRSVAVDRALTAVEARLDPRADEVLLPSFDEARAALSGAGRITIAFHPDRLDRRGLTTAEGLLVDGGYLSQWLTGASSGSRSASPGGLRASWYLERIKSEHVVGELTRHIQTLPEQLRRSVTWDHGK